MDSLVLITLRIPRSKRTLYNRACAHLGISISSVLVNSLENTVAFAKKMKMKSEG